MIRWKNQIIFLDGVFTISVAYQDDIDMFALVVLPVSDPTHAHVVELFVKEKYAIEALDQIESMAAQVRDDENNGYPSWRWN